MFYANPETQQNHEIKYLKRVQFVKYCSKLHLSHLSSDAQTDHQPTS